MTYFIRKSTAFRKWIFEVLKRPRGYKVTIYPTNGVGQVFFLVSERSKKRAQKRAMSHFQQTATFVTKRIK